MYGGVTQPQFVPLCSITLVLYLELRKCVRFSPSFSSSNDHCLPLCVVLRQVTRKVWTRRCQTVALCVHGPSSSINCMNCLSWCILMHVYVISPLMRKVSFLVFPLLRWYLVVETYEEGFIPSVSSPEVIFRGWDMGTRAVWHIKYRVPRVSVFNMSYYPSVLVLTSIAFVANSLYCC